VKLVVNGLCLFVSIALHTATTNIISVRQEACCDIGVVVRVCLQFRLIREVQHSRFSRFHSSSQSDATFIMLTFKFEASLLLNDARE
jgi:hypothetical protein